MGSTGVGVRLEDQKGCPWQGMFWVGLEFSLPGITDGVGTRCLSPALSETVGLHPTQVTSVSYLLSSQQWNPRQWACLGKLEPERVTNAKEAYFL